MMDVADKNVLVVGLGLSGLSAARALARLGARVRVSDSSSSPALKERAQLLESEGIAVELGGHERRGTDADLAVVSPGIPPHTSYLRSLESAGIRMIGEVELAYQLADCDFLAVTGTNGKTTTTSLVAAMLTESGIECVAAGNIGLPLVDAVAGVSSRAAVAVEVSSFQLATIEEFRPRIAVLLNVAEDHTDWHGSFDDYLGAKARIVANQLPEDVFVYNLDDFLASSVALQARSRAVPFSARSDVDEGIGVSAGALVWRGTEVLDVADVPLPGLAGLEDICAAAGTALEYGADPAAVARAVEVFRPLRHRLETVAEIDGVSYIDDSKATNPHAALTAVKGLQDVILIAGGRSKGIDLAVLVDAVPPVIGVVALGEAAQEVVDAFSGLVPTAIVASMRAAVRAAHDMSIGKGSVLLSPGCASLDMYSSYAERGEDFAAAVKELIAEDK